MASSYATTEGIDLQADAVVLAQRFGSKIHFLQAAYDLETCKNASSFYFRRHSRKIITLIEIAKKTLLAMGVQPYPFSTCPPLLVPYKTAYIDLLFLLEKRLHDIDPSLEARVNSLLFPLHAESHVTGKGELSSGPFPRVSPVLLAGCAPSSSQRLTDATSAACSATLMPPPDSRLPVINVKRKRRVYPRKNMYGEDEEASSRRLRATNPDDNEQEHDIPAARLYNPLRRRFGIFCTPKSSMHTYRQPTTYSRPSGPLKE
ncbi:hypothetical protein E4T56_gene1260 [Termitomyces sp. T112]|nr:hypothetical protein E4T56_gene1260 [Termitomyces sp. T112]